MMIRPEMGTIFSTFNLTTTDEIEIRGYYSKSLDIEIWVLASVCDKLLYYF